MVKRYTRKNRTLKGGGVTWELASGHGRTAKWRAKRRGAKGGGAVMYNAIITYLGYDAFITAYNLYRVDLDPRNLPLRDGSQPPRDVTHDNVLPFYLTAILEKNTRDDTLAASGLIPTLEIAIRERAEDMVRGPKPQLIPEDKAAALRHAERAKLEYTFLTELKRKSGVGGLGSSTNDLTALGHHENITYERDRALFSMPDCLEFIGSNCNKPHAHAEDFACSATVNQACKQGYRDELLQDMFGHDYTTFKRDYNKGPPRRWWKPRGGLSRNAAWKEQVRNRMRNKLNPSERQLADRWIRYMQTAGEDNPKMDHNIWLKAKAGILPNETPKARLLRRQNNFHTLLGTNPINLKAKEGLARITAVIDRMRGEAIGKQPGPGFGTIASSTSKNEKHSTHLQQKREEAEAAKEARRIQLEEITQSINSASGRTTEIETRLQKINDTFRGFREHKDGPAEMKIGEENKLNVEKAKLRKEKHNLEIKQLPQLRNKLQAASELEWWESGGKRGTKTAHNVVVDTGKMTGRWKNNEEARLRAAAAQSRRGGKEEDFIFGSFTNEERARLRRGGKRTRKHRKHKKKRKKKRKTKRKAIRKAKRKTKKR